MALDSFSTKNISNSTLNFGIWYVEHKLLFRRIFFISLIISIVILYSFNLWTTIKLFVVDKNKDANVLYGLTANTINFTSLQQRFKPRDISIVNTKILYSSETRKDIVVEVVNPSSAFMAKKASYQFVSGTKILSHGETYLWPQEKKYIIAYGIPNSEAAEDVQLQFTRVSWYRMPEFKDIIGERLDFPITNVQFIPPMSMPGGKQSMASVQFEVENRTIFSYWDVGFTIILYNGNDIVGANYAQLHTFMSSDKQKVDEKFLANTSSVTNVEIVPELNILDDNVYIPDDEVIGEPK